MKFNKKMSVESGEGRCLSIYGYRTGLRFGVKIPSFSGALIMLTVGVLSFGLETQATQTDNWHPLTDIRQTASDFVSAQATNPGQRTTVKAGELDNRLRLHRCGVALEAYLPPGARIGKNTTVGVRCALPKPWKLFVPVRVGVAATILVTAKALPAGTVLTNDDVMAQERDLGALHGGYIAAGETVAGMVLRRRLPQGQPLRHELLTAPNAIRRGQKVTIRSGSGNGPVSISMAGTALSDGRMGQRIRVKNRSSGRIIEGVVQSSELVQIAYE